MYIHRFRSLSYEVDGTVYWHRVGFRFGILDTLWFGKFGLDQLRQTLSLSLRLCEVVENYKAIITMAH